MPDKHTELDRIGAGVRRQVLGDVHVDRASRESTAFDQAFQDLVVRSAWGTVWSRSELTPRERSMITIAILAALGHQEEFTMHVRSIKNTGATQEDVRECLLHVAVYAGLPAANTAFRIAKAVFAEREQPMEGPAE